VGKNAPAFFPRKFVELGAGITPAPFIKFNKDRPSAVFFISLPRTALFTAHPIDMALKISTV
jgi:hypothetical protein